MKVSVPFPLLITSIKCCGCINTPHGGTRIPNMVHTICPGIKNACTVNASCQPAFDRLNKMSTANIVIIFKLCGILSGIFG